jgi:hypothetical protein
MPSAAIKRGAVVASRTVLIAGNAASKPANPNSAPSD